MNAKLIEMNRYGAELRYAARRTDTWPGYHDTMPLGRAGYWFGTAQKHDYLGRSRPFGTMLCFYEIPKSAKRGKQK